MKEASSPGKSNIFFMLMYPVPILIAALFSSFQISRELFANLLPVILMSWLLYSLLVRDTKKSKYLKFLLAVSPVVINILILYLTSHSFLSDVSFLIINLSLFTTFFTVLFIKNNILFILFLCGAFGLGVLSIYGEKIEKKAQRVLYKKNIDYDHLSLEKSKVLNTHLNRIKIDFYKIPTRKKPGIYNFATEYENKLIWSDAHANFYVITEFNDVKPLDIKVETNEQQYGKAAKPGTQLQRFSVKDIEVYRNDLYVSHHYWDKGNQCYSLRVTKIPLVSDSSNNLSAGKPTAIYTSQPCIPAADSFHFGQLMESGGKLAFWKNHLYLTLGDNMNDGTTIPEGKVDTGDYRPNAYAEDQIGKHREAYGQDRNVDYGKTIVIDLSTNIHRLFTIGHRNPQGLTIDSQGNIYASEHGPKGGDEINLLTDGGNYGWPFVTYGTDYFKFTWPLNKNNGEHDKYIKPIFAWVPSIGISDLVILKHSSLEEWNQDFIVTSLKAKTLYRVRLRENRVIYVEPIEIGYPIRDILELKSGDLLLSTTGNTLIKITKYVASDSEEIDIEKRLATSDIANGKTVYDSNCAVCHNTDNTIGPDLSEMFSVERWTSGSFAYSAGLAESKVDWSAGNLDLFLKAPAEFIPDTAMTYEGISDPQERADVVNYLMNEYR